MRLLVDKTMRLVHNDIVNKVVHAPINTFFDVTPNAIIMKRFTLDLDQIDQLVYHFERKSYSVFQTMYIFILMCYMNTWNILIILVIICYQCIMGLKIKNYFYSTHTLRNQQRTPLLSH